MLIDLDVINCSDEDDSLWCPELDVAAFKDYEVEVPRDVLEDLEMDGARCADPDSRVEVTIEEQNQREEQGLPPLMPNVADEDLALVKWKLVRDALLPEPKDFDSEEVNYAPGNFIKNQFEDRGLQVIVKMASIELTPEKPEFPAGGWHVSHLYFQHSLQPATETLPPFPLLRLRVGLARFILIVCVDRGPDEREDLRNGLVLPRQRKCHAKSPFLPHANLPLPQ